MPSRNPQQAAEAVQEHEPSPERPEAAPPTQDASTEIWPTPDDVAPKAPLPPHRHCPVWVFRLVLGMPGRRLALNDLTL